MIIDNLGTKIDEALKMLCEPVKMTLGPKGSNIIIDNGLVNPFITNDGVTIAGVISSDDEILAAIMELAKEASLKTEEMVGDGTTTTLVLLEALYFEGKRLMTSNKVRPITIKQALDLSLNEAINKIEAKIVAPSKANMLNIAISAANDQEIGKQVYEAYQKVESRLAISIKESKTEETKIIYEQGYQIMTNLASYYYLKKAKEISLDNCAVLILARVVEDIAELHQVIEEVIKTKQALLIMADDYSPLVSENIINLNIEYDLNIYLLKNPGYGYEKMAYLEDISLITQSKIINNEKITSKTLGTGNVIINGEYTTFAIAKDINIKKHLENLEANYNLEQDDFLKRRIQMFSHGLVNIFVGGITRTERREKQMRFIDALYALEESQKGIVLGGGVTLFQVSDELPNTIGGKILKTALKVPWYQILLNAGIDSESKKCELKNRHYTQTFNVNTNKWEDILTTSVLDPASVVIRSLKDAVSIAGMLLTTQALIINEPENKSNL